MQWRMRVGELVIAVMAAKFLAPVFFHATAVAR
jgi:hypothetical protein